MYSLRKLIFVMMIMVIMMLLIPMVVAFRLDVSCPPSVNAGSSVTCTIDLSEDITDVFGDQFEINAPGFTAGTPFLDPDTNGVSSYNSGGLGATTVLLKFSEGQPAGPVATFHLVAGTAAGDYVISLTNYVTANSTIPDTITIAGPVTGTSGTTDTGTSGSSSGGGGGGGSSGGGSDGSSGGSSGSRSTPSASDGTSITNVVEEELLQPIEKPVEESLPSEVVQKELSSAGTVSSPKYVWLLLSGTAVLVVVVSLLFIYLRKRAA